MTTEQGKGVEPPYKRMIYKYPLNLVTIIDLPVESKVLAVAAQDGQPMVWIERFVNADAWKSESWCFDVVMTGSEVPPFVDHVGTFHLVEDLAGHFVGHVYTRSVATEDDRVRAERVALPEWSG